MAFAGEEAAQVQRALRAAGKLRLFASPWAPPAWMTESNATTGNPRLRGGPTGPIAHAYAGYLARFFEAYAKENVLLGDGAFELRFQRTVFTFRALQRGAAGSQCRIREVSFWGLTLQNEPAGNTGAWQDLKFSAAEQRDFLKAAAGPALRASPAARDLAVRAGGGRHAPRSPRRPVV